HLAELDFRRRRGVVGRLRSNLGERLPECFIRDGYRGRKACRGEHRLQLHRAIPPWICRMTSRLVRRVNVSPRGAGRVDTQTYLPAQTYFPGLTPISTRECAENRVCPRLASSHAGDIFATEPYGVRGLCSRIVCSARTAAGGAANAMTMDRNAFRRVFLRANGCSRPSHRRCPHV